MRYEVSIYSCLTWIHLLAATFFRLLRLATEAFGKDVVGFDMG